MGMKSMTGFGRGTATGAGFSVEVELGSLNRKQFDARISLPRPLSALEARVVRSLRAKLARGQISATVRVAVSADADANGVVNLEFAKAALGSMRDAAKVLGVSCDVSMTDLVAVPGVLVTSQDGLPDDETAWPVVERALRKALGALQEMRKNEGASLENDLRSRLKSLRKLHGAISARAPRVPLNYRKELMRRLRESGVPCNQSDTAFQRELLLFSDRCDVQEELVRLKSHFDQVEKYFASGKPVGRALDFLCQELFREINTIGSKANDSLITRHVVSFKTELESIREQIQNIE